MFTAPPTTKCAGCGKEVFVSSAFPVKRKGSKKPSWLCTECYDEVGKREKK
jgi:hypothetical protein